MITSSCSRWRDRRGSYRPVGEPINTAAYEVAAIADDNPAKAFVLTHHYSASYPAARRRVGLYARGGVLVGVAVFSEPMNRAAFAPLPRDASVELGRFVLLDQVPANGETWFLARCFELLRADGFAGVISYSDPLERRDAGGRLVFGGHIGNIYQAHNAVYLGRARGDTLRVLPDGSILSRRALSKLRARDRGWRYTAGLLERHGAAPLGADEDARAWADRWCAELARPLRHPGNHKYAWALERAARRALPISLAYPKFSQPEPAALAA
jgi:hypothetical protein